MREERLSEALASALHASEALLDEARTEASLVLRKARRQAKRILNQSARERERAEREIRGLRKALDEATAVSNRMARSLQRLEAAAGKTPEPGIVRGNHVDELRPTAQSLRTSLVQIFPRMTSGGWRRWGEARPERPR